MKQNNNLPINDGLVLLESEILILAESHSNGDPVDFSGLEVCSTDVLKGLDLRGANFTNADLYDLDLSGCNLTGCVFTGAKNINRVKFSGCTIDRETMMGIEDAGGRIPKDVNII